MAKIFMQLYFAIYRMILKEIFCVVLHYTKKYPHARIKFYEKEGEKKDNGFLLIISILTKLLALTIV
jgi:hypothetical protein